ncbi:MAG: hypothetical protein WBF58_04195 [Xanthobacteraceae bacterium]
MNAATVNPNLSSVVAVDAEGRQRGLKRFYHDSETETDILWFHGSEHVLPELVEAGLISSRRIICLTFSWFLNPAVLRGLRRAIEKASDLAPPATRISEQLLLIVNSSAELDIVESALPGIPCVLANNASLVDTELFTIRPGIKKEYACVLNSKSLAFKRHYLSEHVENKIYITYDVRETTDEMTKRVDVAAFRPSLIFRDVPQTIVPDHLNSAQVGLILSEEEGACYASLEYLLCGLPVVSTFSRGGRDEYYDDYAAIVCEADSQAVRKAVQVMLGRLEGGDVDPEEVRRRALNRAVQFRLQLANALSRMTLPYGVKFDFFAYLNQQTVGHIKLNHLRNSFIAGLQRTA